MGRGYPSSTQIDCPFPLAAIYLDLVEERPVPMVPGVRVLER